MATTGNSTALELRRAAGWARRWPLALLALTLALAGLAGYKAWRLSSQVAALRETAGQLEATLQPPQTLEAVGRAGPLLAAARAQMAALHGEAAPLLPLAGPISRLPGAPPELSQAAPLLDMGLQLTVAADEGYAALAPVALDRGAGAESLSGAAVDRLVESRPRIEAARRALAEAEAARAQIDGAQLGEATQAQLARLAAALPAANDALDLAVALPAMLGAGGRREYLLIIQNPDELRATGGFISGAGVLAFERGQLAELRAGDSVDVDDIARNYYPDPPEPMLRYMNIEQWLFRDANWSPDFPTSARQALELYGMGQKHVMHDAIAFDMYLMRDLLQAIGPVSVAGVDGAVDAANVVEVVRAPTGPERELVKARLARAILDALWANAASLDVVAVGGALRSALDERHLLVLSSDPTAAALLARHGWDGAVRPGDGDFLMLAESNIGYNKANANIERALAYAVDLADPAAPRAMLSLRYAHRGPEPGPCVHIGEPEPAGLTQYEAWMRRCYYNYLRVLVPAGSQLTGSKNEPTPAEWLMMRQPDDGAFQALADEAGARVFAGLVVTPRGGERMASLSYTLPPAVLARSGDGWRYRLRLQKQPGTLSAPATVTLRLPAGARLTSSSVPPTSSDETVVTFELELDRDRQLEVTFER